jgi:hypothetical protein
MHYHRINDSLLPLTTYALTRRRFSFRRFGASSITAAG